MAKPPLIIKDFLGNILKEGDSVITIRQGYRSLHEGVIEGFTPKMTDIKLNATPPSTYQHNIRQFHSQVVKNVGPLDARKTLLAFFNMLKDLPMRLGSYDGEKAVTEFLKQPIDD